MRQSPEQHNLYYQTQEFWLPFLLRPDLFRCSGLLKNSYDFIVVALDREH